MRHLYTFLILTSCFTRTLAQQKTPVPTPVQLQEVTVLGYKTSNGIGHLTDSQDQIIYSGKKTEVILTDSVDANKAINNTRQILGRIPGLNIVESETGGFVANGVGIRGLNPAQSLEMNVRQNGYTIAADVYGYNESYYLPPMEAVGRIEIVKGASSLSFGSQFGGAINYVIKSGAADRKIEFTSMQTGGSFGLFNTYNAVGGTIGKVNYFGYVQYRTLQGWRPNSAQHQFSGFGKLSYRPTSRLTVGVEYSILRNRIKMPGGLTDEQYEEDSRQSIRNRNYLQSPWNVLTASLTYALGAQTSVSLKSTYLAGERSLVWFDEEPDELDIPDANGVYENRDIEREYVKSSTNELRLLTNYQVGRFRNTLAGGVRVAYSSFKRREDGTGTNGSDFDLTLKSRDYGLELDFTTTNVAPFIENVFRLTDRFSVTPGVRLEYLSSEATGEIEDEDSGTEIEADTKKSRTFALFGVGAQYQAGASGQFYGNISQAYRPITYADLTPIGVSSRIDPNLKDAKGYTIDIGYRGTWKNILNVDLGVFYLAYNNRLGLVARTENGQEITVRTNVANSLHKGIESYLELDILRLLTPANKRSSLRIFNSLAYIDARYKSGEFTDKKVEYAPAVINRVGLTYRRDGFSATAQLSHQSDAFGDASNAERSDDGIVGKIPAYAVADFSATYQLGPFKVKAGVNNIGDRRYFTQRTDEYPGPGIIPSIGRNGYVGIGLTIR